MTILRASSISLRFPRLVGMAVVDLRVASLARTLVRKAQVAQSPAAMEVDLRAASLALARTLVRKEGQAVQIPAAVEAVNLADLDLANNKVRLLADHRADHQAARVLAKTQRLEIQDLAAAEILLVPRAMVNKDRRGVQGTAAMEVLRAVRVLAKTAKAVVPVLELGLRKRLWCSEPRPRQWRQLGLGF
jgi:hypothetical protein